MRPSLAFRYALIAVVIGGVLGVFPRYIHAFVQTMTCYPTGQFRCRENETPKAVHWPTLCVTYFVNDRGSTHIEAGPDGLISDELYSAIRESFDQWNDPSCSNMKLIDGGLTRSTAVEYVEERGSEGNMNVILWQDDKWPYASASAVALTSVTFRPSNGHIVDADIELNGEYYTFTNTEGAQGAIVDVRNTLTHEIGHFIGFDHSNNPESTMYATAPMGEIKKRHLHQIDIEGLCTVYPEDGRELNCSIKNGSDSSDEQKTPLDNHDQDSSSRGPDSSSRGHGSCASIAPNLPFRSAQGLFGSLALLCIILWRGRLFRKNIVS